MVCPRLGKLAIDFVVEKGCILAPAKRGGDKRCIGGDILAALAYFLVVAFGPSRNLVEQIERCQSGNIGLRRFSCKGRLRVELNDDDSVYIVDDALERGVDVE